MNILCFQLTMLPWWCPWEEAHHWLHSSMQATHFHAIALEAFKHKLMCMPLEVQHGRSTIHVGWWINKEQPAPSAWDSEHRLHLADTPLPQVSTRYGTVYGTVFIVSIWQDSMRLYSISCNRYSFHCAWWRWWALLVLAFLAPYLHHTIHICKTYKNPKKSQWQKNMVKNNITMEVI